jgi:predicted PhzF superfamily epimerase YddE/YHI9
MQAVAKENNLAETAFLSKRVGDGDGKNDEMTT